MVDRKIRWEQLSNYDIIKSEGITDTVCIAMKLKKMYILVKHYIIDDNNIDKVVELLLVRKR